MHTTCKLGVCWCELVCSLGGFRCIVVPQTLTQFYLHDCDVGLAELMAALSVNSSVKLAGVGVTKSFGELANSYQEEADGFGAIEIPNLNKANWTNCSFTLSTCTDKCENGPDRTITIAATAEGGGRRCPTRAEYADCSGGEGTCAAVAPATTNTTNTPATTTTVVVSELVNHNIASTIFKIAAHRDL